jgi:hypothetical protein
MGKIQRILKEREIGPGFYDRSARLELEECIHFHFNDLRLFLDKDEFLRLCELFDIAKQKYFALGAPESTDKMHLLANTVLKESSIKNRLAVEIQEDGRVHIHYNQLRMHLTLGDLFLFFEVFEWASKNIPKEYIQELMFDECDCHEVVNEHLETLKAYAEGGGNGGITVHPDDLKVDINKLQSDCGNLSERNFGLPADFPKPYSKTLDKLYLCALYEFIKRYGYARGPLKGKYMVAYNLPKKPYILNSHRLAVLKFLGYESARCFRIEKESNWRDN